MKPPIRRTMRLPQLGKFHRRMRRPSEFVLIANKRDHEEMMRREAAELKWLHSIANR